MSSLGCSIVHEIRRKYKDENLEMQSKKSLRERKETTTRESERANLLSSYWNLLIELR